MADTMGCSEIAEIIRRGIKSHEGLGPLEGELKALAERSIEKLLRPPSVEEMAFAGLVAVKTVEKLTGRPSGPPTMN